MVERKLYFGNDDRDTRANEIMEKVFNVNTKKIIYFSSETPIEILLAYNLIGKPEKMDEYLAIMAPGHKNIPFSSVPYEDKSFYEEVIANYDRALTEDQMTVIYPPIVGKVARRLAVRNRIKVVKKIEAIYKLRMKEFKNIDRYEKLGINDIANYIDSQKLSNL